MIGFHHFMHRPNIKHIVEICFHWIFFYDQIIETQNVKFKEKLKLVKKPLPFRMPRMKREKKKGKKEMKLQHLATNPIGTSINGTHF